MKINRNQLRRLIIESIGDYYDSYAIMRDDGLALPLQKFLDEKGLDYYKVEVYSKPEELLYGYKAADHDGGEGGILFIKCETKSELENLKKLVSDFQHSPKYKTDGDMILRNHWRPVIYSKGNNHMIIIHSTRGVPTN